MTKPNDVPKPPHTVISEPGQSNITVTPRPKGGIHIHRGKLSIALSPAECNRLKFEINRFSMEREDGTGFYEDRRSSTPSTGKYVPNRRGDVAKYTSETPTS
jgi:hypothetical protein